MLIAKATRRQRCRVASAAVAGLLCAATIAAAGDDPSEFIAGLRARKMHDAVEEYLLQLRDKPDLSQQWRQRIPYELGRTHADKAQQLPAGPRRLQELSEAQAALEEFVKRNPEHASLGQARELLGSVLMQRGAGLLEASRDPERADAAEALREKARAAYRQAVAAFDALAADQQARLTALPKFIDPADKQQRAARSRAQSDLIQAQLSRASAVYESAKTHDPDSDRRRQTLEQAAGDFHKIHTTYRRLVAGLYARLHEARCYQALGQQRRARGIYAELLALPDEPAVFAQLKKQANRYLQGGPEAAPAPDSKQAESK